MNHDTINSEFVKDKVLPLGKIAHRLQPKILSILILVIILWIIHLDPLPLFLAFKPWKSLDSPKWFSLYANELTDSWHSLGSFRIVSGHYIDQGIMSALRPSIPPCSQSPEPGESRRLSWLPIITDIINHAYGRLVSLNTKQDGIQRASHMDISKRWGHRSSVLPLSLALCISLSDIHSKTQVNISRDFPGFQELL